VAALLAASASLGAPPERAEAGLLCSAVGAVGGGGGIGNPLGDACDAVGDVALDAAGDALKGAAGSIGDSVFKQITAWVAEGAAWLLGEVSALSEKTTTPDLLSKGFVSQYRQMAEIAVALATLMLFFAVIEGAARGDTGMLGRVFVVNVPLAAIATTSAFAVVQLMLGATDGLCHAVEASAKGDVTEFFDSAIQGLAGAGAEAGAAGNSASSGAGMGAALEVGGAVAVPLFVGFIAAVVAAFAAFFVWIELLMRDAAVYVVALFLPMSIAAAVWPRWSSALRRTAELLCVVVFSKFVIVAIIALAASVLANTEGKIEHVLAAGALLLLACFSPLVLFRLVPFAEGAVAAANGRQSAAGGALRGFEAASSAQMMRNTSRSNWSRFGVDEVGGSPGGGGAKGGGKSAAGGAGSGGGHGGGGALGGLRKRFGGAPGSKAGAGGSAGAAGGGGSGAAGPLAPITAAAKTAQAAAKGAKSAGQRLGGTAIAQEAGGGAPAQGSAPGHEPGSQAAKAGRAAKAAGQKGGGAAAPAEPAQAGGASAPPPGQAPPRPSGAQRPSGGKGGERK
jgi:DNA processing protein